MTERKTSSVLHLDMLDSHTPPRSVRFERSEYPHWKFPQNMRDIAPLPDVIFLRYHGDEVTGWVKSLDVWINLSNGKPAVILSESSNDCVTWKYKGQERQWLTTRGQFLSRFSTKK